MFPPSEFGRNSSTGNANRQGQTGFAVISVPNTYEVRYETSRSDPAHLGAFWSFTIRKGDLECYWQWMWGILT